MKHVTIPLVGVTLGLVLIAGSYYWASPLGPQPKWTEQDARKYSEAATEFHQLNYGPDHGHAHHSENSMEGQSGDLKGARERFEEQQAKLDAARSRHNFWASAIKWSGVVLAAGGVLGFLLLNGRFE